MKTQNAVLTTPHKFFRQKPKIFCSLSEEDKKTFFFQNTLVILDPRIAFMDT